MGKCFAPFCKTGYKSCAEKLSLFKPPNDDARLEAWRAMPRKDRALQRTDRVCEKHFAPHFILKAWSSEIDGHVLMSGNRRTGLTKDAVPSIFEGAPSYLTKKVKSPRKRVKRIEKPAANSVRPRNYTSISEGSSHGAEVSKTAATTHEEENSDGTEALSHSSFED